MSLRDEWRFQFKVGDVHEAAKAERDYHNGRADWWKGERTEAERNLREHGIDVKHFEITGGTQAQAQLDPSLAQRLTQSEGKMRGHQKSAQEFDRWAIALSKRQADDTIDLDKADFDYFFPAHEVAT